MQPDCYTLAPRCNCFSSPWRFAREAHSKSPETTRSSVAGAGELGPQCCHNRLMRFVALVGEAALKEAWWVAGVLSIASSILSVFVLLQHGLEFGIAAPLAVLFEAYDWGVRLVADKIIGPALQFMLDALTHLIDWPLKLRPGWHHVFVVLVGYATSIAWATRYLGISIGRDSLFRALASIVILWFLALFFLAATAVKGSANVNLPMREPILPLVFYAALLFALGAGLQAMGNRLSERLKKAFYRAAWINVAVPMGTLAFVVMNAGLSLLSSSL